MADEVVEQKDVNIQAVAPESSPEASQGESVKSPTAEGAATGSQPENKIPQKRFNEVIQERNLEREARERLEARIRELELSRAESGPKRKSVADMEVERLMRELSMEEGPARAIVKTYENLSQAQIREQELRQSRFQAETWAETKAKEDPAYREIEPMLDRSFSGLKPQMQAFLAQNPEALEMFYESVKAKHLSSKSNESYAKGAEEAYKTKMTKQAVSSVSGASSSVGKTALSREAIRKMDTAEYMKRLPEINEAIAKGTLK